MPIEVTAVDRARWLVELADALEQAQRLTWRMGLSGGGNADAMELYGRLEAARVEAQSLQLGGFKAASSQYSPAWIELLPWREGEDG
jgi:hypothetical protein